MVIATELITNLYRKFKEKNICYHFVKKCYIFVNNILFKILQGGIMKKININRRSFLKNSGRATGFVALAGGMVQLNAFNAWAAKKSSLDSHVAKTMLLVSKDLFPGKKFSDELYI